jgi:hypothetical protein
MPKRFVDGILAKDEGLVSADDIAPSLHSSTHREWIKKMRYKSRVARVIMDGKSLSFDPAGPPVNAIVNHGRWLAVCECGGAELVSPNDPIFFCFSCCNSAHDYHVRPVQFPKGPDKIEKALMKRADPKHRNWESSESLADLEAQTVAHEKKVAREKKVKA